MICSQPEDLQREINHLEKVFCETNEYPTSIVKRIIEEERSRRQQRQREETTEPPATDNQKEEEEEEEEEKVIYVNLPYAGTNGENLLKKLRQDIEKKSRNLKIRVTYTPTKLGSMFVVKDKTKMEHLHNVTYHIECGNKKCDADYTGQTKCRIIKRTMQHNRNDNASHVLIHSKATKHRRVSMKNVKILGRRYRSDFKRRISESLHIKELKPKLNKQKDAFKLKLYN